MKLLRYIIFIPLIYVIIGLIYISLPLSFFGLMSLSKSWITLLLIFFGGVAVSFFTFMPGVISWLSSKIAPNNVFAFYSTLTISVLLGILQIYGFWTNPNLTEYPLGILFGITLSCLTIGFASSLSIGAGVDMFDEKDETLEIFVLIGTIIFYIGIFLTFCVLSNIICHIKLTKTYSWYSGIWHGIFVIPNWVVSWFTDGVYCKAPNSTTAYSIWWWISFILTGFGILGGSNNRR